MTTRSSPATPLSRNSRTPSGSLAAKATGLLAVMTILCGVVYPATVTALARVAFPREAAGSLITEAGVVRGSVLLGQATTEPRYFWGRLSGTAPAYHAGASSGTNLGPTNDALTKAAAARIEALRAADPGDAPIPVDLVTASGSGLDPHVSPAAAYFQAGRVARARGMNEAAVRALVSQHVEERQLGLLGERRVNVLRLNLALDAAQRAEPTVHGARAAP